MILAEARRLVAEPPDGILPTAVKCMIDIVEAASTGNAVPAIVLRLLDDLEKSNASAAVPKALEVLDGPAREKYARGAVSKLGQRWLQDPKRIEREWVVELLSALPVECAGQRRPGET